MPRRRVVHVGALAPVLLLAVAACSGSRGPDGDAGAAVATTTSATTAVSVTSPASDPARAGGVDDMAPPTTGETTTTTTRPPLVVPGPEGWRAFDRSLRDRLIGGGDRAASVAVAINGEIVHAAAFGERVPGDPARTSDRFRIASISKVIAAVAMLRLVENGDIGLDDPVTGSLANWLGVVPREARVANITPRQLLGHTSGFGDYENDFFGGGADSCRTAAAFALAGGLIAKPGTAYNYSNMNYCVIGLLLEQRTGKRFDQVLFDEVLTPLGIDNLRLAGTFDVGPDDVEHYSTPQRNYMEVLGAAGSWVATPSDIVRLVDSLDPTKEGWHPLGNRLLAQMKAPSTAGDRGGSGPSWYGLGLMVFGDGSFGHTGTLESTHAMVVSRPDGVTWAITVSGENPWETPELRPIIDEAFAAGGFGPA
jgi:D-alanyl-D-alanine carboxypeptidase